MTTALRSDETTALSAPGDALQVSARMSVFLAEELLPLMAGLWPGGACSGASMRSRFARQCCSLGRMPIGSSRRGRQR